MKKVLVIDDHESSRRHLVESLRRCGYDIAAEGASGRVASALAHASAAEVIVMAVGLADLDGIEAAREIMQNQAAADRADYQSCRSFDGNAGRPMRA